MSAWKPLQMPSIRPSRLFEQLDGPLSAILRVTQEGSGDELAGAVRLVTAGEAAGQHNDLRLADSVLHAARWSLSDGIRGAQVADHEQSSVCAARTSRTHGRCRTRSWCPGNTGINDPGLRGLDRRGLCCCARRKAGRPWSNCAPPVALFGNTLLERTTLEALAPAGRSGRTSPARPESSSGSTVPHRGSTRGRSAMSASSRSAKLYEVRRVSGAKEDSSQSSSDRMSKPSAVAEAHLGHSRRPRRPP